MGEWADYWYGEDEMVDKVDTDRLERLALDVFDAAHALAVSPRPRDRQVLRGDPGFDEFEALLQTVAEYREHFGRLITEALVGSDEPNGGPGATIDG